MIEPYKNQFDQRHWNAIAKDIREELSKYLGPNGEYSADAIDALIILAFRIARRFVKDKRIFDPVVWLNQCSPDQDLYPIGELWDEHE